MTADALTVDAADEAAMVACGARLARAASAGLVIYLRGDLGMGKTTLSRGFIQGLGHTGAVKSPTYTLVEPYLLGEWTLYHFDLYRLGHAEELEFMGIRDYFGDSAVCLVEWPERGEGALPPADITIKIQKQGSGRRLVIYADSLKGEAMLMKMRTQG